MKHEILLKHLNESPRNLKIKEYQNCHKPERKVLNESILSINSSTAKPAEPEEDEVIVSNHRLSFANFDKISKVDQRRTTFFSSVKTFKDLQNSKDNHEYLTLAKQIREKISKPGRERLATEHTMSNISNASVNIKLPHEESQEDTVTIEIDLAHIAYIAEVLELLIF